MDIVERHIAYESAPEAFRELWAGDEERLSDRIAAAREIVDSVEYTRRDLFTIATLTSNLHVDGHRADLVILKTARANAAFEGRRNITHGDILLALELAIPHRLKRGPFTDAQMSMAEVERQMDQIESEWGEGDEADQQAEDGQQEAVKKKVPR